LRTGIASAESAKEELPAAEIQEVIEEIDEHVHELINGTMALHDNTEQIADNETLDEDLRAKAEEVHVASHELLYIAEDIQELVEELGDLGKDPASNKAKMGEAIDEIKEHLEDYTEALEANHDLVHDILSTVPETHKAYAEATQDAMYELESTVEASQLKRLIRKMNKPAHNVPGDAGAGIHTQFHRVEGFAVAIHDSVKELDELAEDQDKNKADMRELVVEKLWVQLGDLGTAIDGMSDLIDQALSADPDDANAQKCEDLLYEMEDVQDAIREHVSELAAKVQDPIVWEYPCMGAMNSHRLANGNTLIAEAFADRVIEVTLDKEIVWEYTGVVYPTDSQRLENGNTLIADKGNKRVIEVTPAKEIVWEYLGGGQELTSIYGVRALDNGNVLIADQGNMQDPASRARIIEVTPDKEIIWEYDGPAMEFICPSLGGRLANGNTLIADNAGLMDGEAVYVREITPDKEIAWEYSEGLTCVYVVHRVANGNTLICAQCDGCIIEVTPDKEIVWAYGAMKIPTGMQRLANGNTLISVFGENRVIEVTAP
jgi:ABC-type transporter Mla subunit MlaD